MTVAILLTVLAFGLAMLELAFPSFGLLSLASATAYAFALIYGFREGATVGWSLVGAGVLLLPLAVILGLKLLPNTPFGKRLFLQGPGGDAIQRGTRDAAESAYVGQDGVATTDLRPSGQIDVGGHRLDVVAQGSFVSRGTRVRITSVTGQRVTVAPLPELEPENT